MENTQNITSKYGVELGANINYYHGDMYVLKDPAVANIFDGRAIGMVNIFYDEGAAASIHDHPLIDSFSTNDIATADARTINAYVSMPNHEIDFYQAGSHSPSQISPPVH